MTTDRLPLPSALPEWQRSGRFFLIAVVLHAAALFYPLQIAISKLELPPPDTIMVRLVETVSPRLIEPAKTQPSQPTPTARPVRERPTQTSNPVLAMQPEQSAPTPAYTVAAPVSSPPTAQAAPASVPTPAATVTAARFNAAYLNNPEPKYPPLSRRLGEEGKVLLKVRVTADGQPSAVDLEKTSSFERLDAAARQAVARWRFVPAKRGDEAIEATVIVPIVFRLDS